jgi:hypothetical protein
MSVCEHRVATEIIMEYKVVSGSENIVKVYREYGG